MSEADDEEFAGPPPDPSQRQWVHPSELAGRAAEPTPPPRKTSRRLIGLAAVVVAGAFAGTALMINQAVTLEPAQEAVTVRVTTSSGPTSSEQVTTTVAEADSAAGTAPQSPSGHATTQPTPASAASGAGGWIGVAGVDAADGMGVVLTECDHGGPARKAGLRPDDVVTHIDGATVDSMAVLSERVGALSPGDVVEVTVHRKGEPVAVSVEVGDASEPGS